MGLTLAAGGWMSNLIVYLIQEFNVESINAAQISNIVNGCSNLFPVIGAIVADSFLTSFSVVTISACISLLVRNILSLSLSFFRLIFFQYCAG
jgi:peptide/histidine transporter 3/4